MILAVDPGNIESAYVIVENDLSKVIEQNLAIIINFVLDT